MRVYVLHLLGIVLCAAAALLLAARPAAAAVDFDKEIKPIIESACLHCHKEGSEESELRLDSLAGATADQGSGPTIIPGNPEKSSFYKLLLLPADDDERMPPDGPPLDESQITRIREWIKEGAHWPKEAALVAEPRMDFVQHVQPILEANCISCHSAKNPEAGLDLSTRDTAFMSGDNAPAIKPFDAANSPLYATTILAKDDEHLMPPSKEGGPLSKEMTDILRLWISQGAIWPKDVTLKAREKKSSIYPNYDDLALVEKIHAKIVDQAKVEAGKYADYTAKVPRTGAAYSMVALKGGSFLMGSPAAEKNRSADEGPQTKVEVSPFWLGKYEVTWNEFEPFMITTFERYKNGARKDYDPATATIVDAVSGPTRPYADMTFGFGKQGYPAICMTQHAANKYCEWLSAQTGHFYRLPTEAEWEYACRAGAATAYFFGDDPAKLGQYAWYYENSDEKSHKVGEKKPNPWGLYDMHGNVMEWTADQYVPNYFERLGANAVNPFVRPDPLYPRSVRGGSWNEDAENVRAARRLGSEPAWQQQDPQLPKSIWYLTDAPWLGFRILRPKDIPSVDEMYFYWNSSTGKR
ncbi:MAG: SUMF1/EgtB/PvdO family nonheme iron enzyme [Pirellulales bacterium]